MKLRPMLSITSALCLALLASPQTLAGQQGQAPAATTQAASPTPSGDPAHPDVTHGWVSTQLYFGLGLFDAPKAVQPAAGRRAPRKGVTEEEWLAFLDKEVTPRFPFGLSVQDIYGQWQGKQQAQPVRIRSKVLIIVYANTAENQASIEAIRAAWKRKTGDQSVLKVTVPADVSF